MACHCLSHCKHVGLLPKSFPYHTGAEPPQRKKGKGFDNRVTLVEKEVHFELHYRDRDFQMEYEQPSSDVNSASSSLT